MAVIESKNQTERNKMIAAAALGLIALVALYMAFGRGLFGGSAPSTAAKSTPTPKPNVTTAAARPDTAMPTVSEQDFQYQTTPVVYNQTVYAPDPGRNIFAFYEPPVPTPTIPTPLPIKVEKPATPTPTPPIILAAVNPMSIYAGSPGFRLEATGDRFTPDSHIYFNQTELPTTFVNAQKMFTDIPSNLIAQEGPRQVIVQTPDGKLYSNQMIIGVQAPPRPTVQFIGMIGRKRYNNDTAYFLENGKTQTFGARLNDVVGGRFRLVDISASQVVFEDVNLGFKHRVLISKATTTASTGTQPGRGQPADGGFMPFDPNMQNIPGIPNNIPRYVPPPQTVQNPNQQKKQQTDKKEDVDDDGDGGE